MSRLSFSPSASRIPSRSPRRLLRTAWTLTAAAALSACAVGPDYVRPEAPISATFKQLDGWRIASPSQPPLHDAWWDVFGDPTLDRLIRLVDVSNQTLAQAEARYRQAQAAVSASQAGLAPTVQANGSGTRSRAEGGGVGNRYALGTSISWTPDLWGRIRRDIEASTAGVEASAADVAAARLSAQALLARAYFQLRVLDRQKSLLDLTVQAWDRSLTLTQNRYDAGLAARSDLVQAQTQLESVRAQSLDLDWQRGQQEHAIAVLAGLPPAELAIPRIDSAAPTGSPVASTLPGGAYAASGTTAPSGATPASTHAASAAMTTTRTTPAAAGAQTPSQTIPGQNRVQLAGPGLPAIPPPPQALPSTLLERRPDIASEERRMAAANARIGVAEAAWFPDLTLSASGGFQSGSFSQWLTAPARVWSLGPALAATIFDGGARAAGVAQAQAAYDEQVARYRQSVLDGLREVEDALVLLRVLEAESAQQQRVVTLAEESERLVRNQYEAGMVTFLDVAIAQNVTLGSRRTLLSLYGTRLDASVALIAALGGGWQANPATPTQ